MDTARKFGMNVVLLVVLLVAGIAFSFGGELVADDSPQPPQRPTGLVVSTQPGLLTVLVDWDDVPVPPITRCTGDWQDPATG